MKKNITLLFLAFLMSSVYGQVGVNTNEPTAALDINGSLRFREGTIPYATQRISTIIGTDGTDGNVSPNKLNGNGLTSSLGDLKVISDIKGGVIVDNEGLEIKYSNGLIIANDKLSIVPSNGLELSADNLKVVPKSDGGVLVDGDGVGIRVTNGLIIGGNGVTVQPKAEGGIVVDEDGVVINSGEAIITDEKGVNVNYDNGLTLNNANQLIVDMDYINGQNNNTIGSIGDGLQYKREDIPENIIDYLVSVEAGKGISVTSTGVAVRAGNGITTDSDNIAVRVGNGITTDSGSVAVRAGNGITTASGSVTVSAGDAITVSDGSVNVKAGNGAVIYDDKVSIKTGIGTYINSSEEVDIKLDPNSSMKLEPSYGLKLQTHPDGGLRIQDDASGESRLRIVLDSNSGLKMGAEINTSYSPLSVNTNTNKGLGVDVNGIYVKLGDGLRYDDVGYLERIVDNSGTLTSANNGLSKNENGDIITLGGKLIQPNTLIGTDETNTLALTKLNENLSANYQILVVDNENKIRKTNIPVLPNTAALPAILTLKSDIQDFMIDSGSYPWDAGNQTIGWDFIVNNIGLRKEIITVNDTDNNNNITASAQGTSITLPAGIYQITVGLKLEKQGFYPCEYTSFFIGFPFITRSAPMTADHKKGVAGGTINMYASTSYTFQTRDPIDWKISFGQTQNLNSGCGFTSNGAPTLKKDGTQIVIYRMGDAN